jgi:hypothetical protein
MMKKYIIYFLFISLIFTSCVKQQVATDLDQTFSKYFGLHLKNEGVDVKQLQDGGYLVLGTTTNDEGRNSVYMMRTNNFGNPTWAKEIEGSENETGVGLQVLPDGNFIVVGNVFVSDSVKVMLHKIDNSGNVLWVRQVAYQDKVLGEFKRQFANSLQLTSSGGIVIAGKVEYNTASAAMLIFTDINGLNPEFSIHPKLKSTTKSKSEARYISEMMDGKFIVIGATDNTINSKGLSYVLISIVKKYDLEYSFSTNAYFGGVVNDTGYCVKVISDSSFMCLGSKATTDSGANINIFKIKMNSNDGFDKEWEKSFGTLNNDKASSLEMISKNEFALTGTVLQSNGNSSTLFHKFDGVGNVIVSKSFGLTGKHSARKLVKTNDNGFAIVGSNENSTFSLINLMKIMDNGDY